MRIELTVNGEARRVEAPPMARLLDLLREELRLTGTKEGCGEGECGSCTVLVDGDPVCACLVPVFQMEGREVLTVEHLAKGSDQDALTSAIVQAGGVQCGACTPGIMVALKALLDHEAAPKRDAIREALAGNLCRCTGYESILRAMEPST